MRSRSRSRRLFMSGSSRVGFRMSADLLGVLRVLRGAAAGQYGGQPGQVAVGAATVGLRAMRRVAADVDPGGGSGLPGSGHGGDLLRPCGVRYKPAYTFDAT